MLKKCLIAFSRLFFYFCETLLLDFQRARLSGFLLLDFSSVFGPVLCLFEVKVYFTHTCCCWVFMWRFIISVCQKGAKRTLWSHTNTCMFSHSSEAAIITAYFRLEWHESSAHNTPHVYRITPDMYTLKEWSRLAALPLCLTLPTFLLRILS